MSTAHCPPSPRQSPGGCLPRAHEAFPDGPDVVTFRIPSPLPGAAPFPPPGDRAGDRRPCADSAEEPPLSKPRCEPGAHRDKDKGEREREKEREERARRERERGDVRRMIPAVPLDLVVPYTPEPAFEDLYCVGHRIAEGTYGEVFHATHRASNTPVVVKRFKPLPNMDGFPVTSLRELTVLKSLRLLPPEDRQHFVTLRHVLVGRDWGATYVTFDLVQHSLAGLLSRGFAFTAMDVQVVFRQVLRGVAALHRNQIIHRDIKPNNILVDDAAVVKVCDFGLAVSTSNRRDRSTPSLVALDYRPPEMLIGSHQYTAAVDVWSTGCMLAQMFTGLPPFAEPGRGRPSEIDQIRAVAARLHLPLWALLAPDTVATCHERCRSLLARPDGAAAPPPHEPALRAWLQDRARQRQRTMPGDVLDVVVAALQPEPTRRPSAEDLLRFPFFARHGDDTRAVHHLAAHLARHTSGLSHGPVRRE